MAASMALGGSSLSLGMGTSSPIMSTGMGLNGSLTPSHTIIKREYCESGTSSVHSPISTHGSPQNSTINMVNSGSMSKGQHHHHHNHPGSGMNSNNSMDGDGENLSNMMGSNSNSSSSVDLFGSKCKRKINFSNLGMPGRTHQPATVARRNARERNRVKQVNNGFSSLKQHIPLGHRSKKMSKVETLRCAVDYIRNLQGLLSIHNSFSVASPADSNASSEESGDMMMDDENVDEIHQSSQQQQQMNGVNNQREGYALSSSSSSSSSPTSSSEFSAVAAHLPHHLAALHSHHQNNSNQQPQQQQHQQHLGNNNNQLRHLSLSHHHLHGTSGVSVAAALLLGSSANTVTPSSNQLSPTSSEDPSSPSYASEVSYVNSNGNPKGSNGVYDYEKYEPVSPEDEELLDAIAWWQQS